MNYNPKVLSFLISLGIATVSTLILWLIAQDVKGTFFLISFVVIMVSAGVITYLFFNRYASTEVEKMQDALDAIMRGEAAETPNPDDPFERYFSDLRTLLREKQNEIERLKNIEVFRKDFVADVSHELKTPIFAAQGFVHTLLDGAVKEKAVRKKFLKKAAKSLDGLDMLVQDLLTLSQIETGQIKMRFGEVDLYELTQEAFEQLKGKANRKNISLNIEGNFRKVLVHADGQRIGQVLTNLISNAIKYSEEGGEVTVSFSVRKQSVITRVKDRGEGIPAEHLDRIFERFYRVDKSRSREKGGTGLGLAIVKHILDGHGTKALVESEPGKGSTFSFRLPRYKVEKDGI